MSNVLALTEELLIKKMRSAGLRLTLPRRAVIRALIQTEEPFISARNIIDKVQESTGRIEASTVYRILEDLSRIGLVHHVPFRNGRSGKWHVTLSHDHEHLVCEYCAKTITIPDVEVAPLFELFRRKYGFHTSPHHFAFVGFCEDCGPQNDHPHPQRAG